MRESGVIGRSRVWYEADEIEDITADALRQAALWPRPGALAIDIEHLVEVFLGAAVDYGVSCPSAPSGSPNSANRTEWSSAAD